MRVAAVGLALGLAMASAPAMADECEALAAGIAAATHLPAQPSGRDAFEFDMLGIHSRMFLFCGAPQTRISARDYAERIPPPALITMASVAAAQFGGSAAGDAYSAISGCIQRALRSNDGMGSVDLGPMSADCITTGDRSEINISSTSVP
jgi:hypothetical protein